MVSTSYAASTSSRTTAQTETDLPAGDSADCPFKAIFSQALGAPTKQGRTPSPEHLKVRQKTSRPDGANRPATSKPSGPEETGKDSTTRPTVECAAGVLPKASDDSESSDEPQAPDQRANEGSEDGNTQAGTAGLFLAAYSGFQVPDLTASTAVAGGIDSGLEQAGETLSQPAESSSRLNLPEPGISPLDTCDVAMTRELTSTSESMQRLPDPFENVASGLERAPQQPCTEAVAAGDSTKTTTGEVLALGSTASNPEKTQMDTTPQPSSPPPDNASTVAQQEIFPGAPDVLDPDEQTLGTAGAKQHDNMKKSDNPPQIAVRHEQKLPGNNPTGFGRSVRAGGERQSQASSGLGQVDVLASTTVTSNGPAVAANSPVAAPSGTGHGTEAQLQQLERTHDLVALHAIRFRASGTDTMRVVVEPGQGIRLTIEMKRQDGEIAAQALLQGGDFDYLSSHWAELQQRLEPQGVHLSALENSVQSTADKNTSDHPKRRGGQDSGKSLNDFVFGGAMTESPVKGLRRKTHRGWETWA
jgi:hypothetical protein